MSDSRRLVWIILVLGVLLAVSMAFWLAVLYTGMASLPNALARFGKAVSEAQDLAVLKTACMSLADLNEQDRAARLNFLLVSAGAAIVFGLLCGALSVRLLFVMKADGPSK